MTCTALGADLDPEGRTLTYARAGHEPGLLLRAGRRDPLLGIDRR